MTVALECIDDLALTRNMPLTVANMAFGVSEVS
jgi:hypothetical protein